MKMQFVKLKNGLVLPMLGIGTTDLTANEGADKIKAALVEGYRLIDTATAYGNHAAVAQAIRDSGVARKDITICTKINDSDLVKSSVDEVVAKMLHDLAIDYLDIVLIHSPAVLQNFPDRNVVAELVKLKQEGLIKSIGVSNFSQNHFALLGDNLQHIDINQIEISPYCQQPDLVEFCRSQLIHVTAYRPFGKNKTGELLAQKSQSNKEPMADLLRNHTLAKIAANHQKTIPQIILGWLLRNGFSTIPKAGTVAHLRENSEVFDIRLTNEEFSAIKSLNMNLITCPWEKYVKTQARDKLFTPKSQVSAVAATATSSPSAKPC